MKLFRRLPSALPALVFLASFAPACGENRPPAAPSGASAKPVAAPRSAAPDLRPVPEPEGLVVVGRVKKPEAIFATVAAWTRLPLPAARDLVRSTVDDALGDVVDLSQPLDAAVALGGDKRNPKLLAAISVPVLSYEGARRKLAGHKLKEGPNGQLFIEGLGKPAVSVRGMEDEDDEGGDGCLLAPAPSGGRIVCGEHDALELLVGYLTRTASRQDYPADVHFEVRPEPIREPLGKLRSTVALLARSMTGTSSPSLRELLDATITELVDLVGDLRRVTFDAQVADAGVEATMRFDYAGTTSLMARLATSGAPKAGPPPAAFWHLPAETDLAGFARGSDPKLFDRPREILANVAIEAAEAEGMPAAERRALRELAVDRTLPLFTGGLVYGKGFDDGAVEKAASARREVKDGDVARRGDSELALVEQVVGWHLLQVGEPFAKVGPILKEWSALWNRPAFATWARKQASSKMLARLRIAPAPPGAPLPKETVHLEITLPRSDVETAPGAKGGKGGGKAKPIKRKPVVAHVLAVPDGGATWLAFGLDAKLLAKKVAASLSSAPEGGTLAKAGGYETLRDAKASGAGVVTLRGLAVLSALDGAKRGPFSVLSALPGKGETPIVFTWSSSGPTDTAAAGSSTTTFRMPRAAIEDIVKTAMTAR